MEFEFRLIELLVGRMNLLQPQPEREELVNEIISLTLSSGEFPQLKGYFDHSDERIGRRIWRSAKRLFR